MRSVQGWGSWGPLFWLEVSTPNSTNILGHLCHSTFLTVSLLVYSWWALRKEPSSRGLLLHEVWVWTNIDDLWLYLLGLMVLVLLNDCKLLQLRDVLSYHKARCRRLYLPRGRVWWCGLCLLNMWHISLLKAMWHVLNPKQLLTKRHLNCGLFTLTSLF